MSGRVATVVTAIIAGALALGGFSVGAAADSSPSDKKESIAELRELPAVMSAVEAPQIEDPEWLQDQLAAEGQAASSAAADKPPTSSGASRTFSYSVESWGNTTTSISDFKAKALATLNDSRGWSRAGAKFSEVPSGGEFTLVLSEAAELERRYAPGCSAEYSCRVGQYVIINQDRWVGATPSWNAAGGSLRDYQHMVINHEIGHWLGHGHQHCAAAGQPAPVMLQQSINLQGCKFNPWPLEGELWIRS